MLANCTATTAFLYIYCNQIADWRDRRSARAIYLAEASETFKHAPYVQPHELFEVSGFFFVYFSLKRVGILFTNQPLPAVSLKVDLGSLKKEEIE